MLCRGQGGERLHQALGVISDLVPKSFAKIAPSWPLHSLTVGNPLEGFEDLPIEDALKMGAVYFQQEEVPKELLGTNTHTIKWMGVYCDEGQATISMPFRAQGLYHAWRVLAPYDACLHEHDPEKIAFLEHLPAEPTQAIWDGLRRLQVEEEAWQAFLTLLLTTLPGWASYIKYTTEGSPSTVHTQHRTQVDYLAVRVVILTVLWPGARALLDWHQAAMAHAQLGMLETIEASERGYRMSLLRAMAAQKIKRSHTPSAQFVFCMDVRSEPFRRSLEAIGDYQTWGCAGFFGIPVQISNHSTGESYTSCPVLLSPKHEVFEYACHAKGDWACKNYETVKKTLKSIYQSLKDNVATSFALVEGLGLFSGLWMGLRSLAPEFSAKIRAGLSHAMGRSWMGVSIANISREEQVAYAEQVLRIMGLTDHFAPVVVFCGHGSQTEHNPYGRALDCGACGGHRGGHHASMIAAMLNDPEVKAGLSKRGIQLPESTQFFAAEHNTTTDELVFFTQEDTEMLQRLRAQVAHATRLTSRLRLKQLGVTHPHPDSAKARAYDWAQVRPEWGLARNAALMIAPRDLSASLDLEGRCFLHSYDYRQDPHAVFLTTILTGPMVVAHRINMHYLFSTLDPVAYGGGSKITQNIVAKMGVMQGNASDLMNGLPLESLYQNDRAAYHEPQRLLVVVWAPQRMLDAVIGAEGVVRNLCDHGWIQLARIDPIDHKIYLLNRGRSWQVVH